ncbi:5'-3' exoribonuclease 3 [Platanthera zijinensis]|uniref:5'-3' exoribonuclease 3 n=1 Tax=Platanthera zijinensis TaxID=2320716 RepID=A0AAP0G0V6_9ASPA
MDIYGSPEEVDEVSLARIAAKALNQGKVGIASGNVHTISNGSHLRCITRIIYYLWSIQKALISKPYEIDDIYGKPYVIDLLAISTKYQELDMKPECQSVIDIERIVDDFIFIYYFSGNDFLPHLPSIKIHEINERSTSYINFQGIKIFISETGSYEDMIFVKRSTLRKVFFKSDIDVVIIRIEEQFIKYEKGRIILEDDDEGNRWIPENPFEVFLQSNIEAVTIRMEEQFIKFGKGRIILEDDDEGNRWLPENPFEVRSDSKQHTMNRRGRIYRTTNGKEHGHANLYDKPRSEKRAMFEGF